MPRIVILDGYTTNPGDNPWDGLAALGDLTVYDHTEPGLTLERAMPADILLTNKTLLHRGIIERLPNVRYIALLSTGINAVDGEAARERAIPVSNVPEYSTASVAQFTFALLLELAHRVQRHSDAVMEGRWVSSRDFCFWDTDQVELAGRTIGIVGFGRIGQAVGRIAHALGMDVLAHSRSRSQTVEYPFRWATTVGELFRTSDVVSLHCPLTDENEGMVDAGLLRTMKPGAFLLNTARGPLVVEEDLAVAIREGVIAGAALDVVRREPMEAASPLLHAPNLIITPHIAWATLAARRNLMRQTVNNVRAFLAGEPVNVVN